MDLNKVQIGEKYYGIIYKYSFKFMKGIKIKELEIIKINPKTIAIAFDKETRRYPQLLKKENTDLISSSKVKLAKDYMLWLKKSKFPDHLKKRINNYCKRIIKISSYNEDNTNSDKIN